MRGEGGGVIDKLESLSIGWYALDIQLKGDTKWDTRITHKDP